MKSSYRWRVGALRADVLASPTRPRTAAFSLQRRSKRRVLRLERHLGCAPVRPFRRQRTCRSLLNERRMKFLAFVFTAGVGENSPTMRAKILERMRWLGAVPDSALNDKGDALISSPTSAVALYIVPTNEELMIARHTLTVLAAR